MKISSVRLTDTFLRVHWNGTLGPSVGSNKFETRPWCKGAALAGDRMHALALLHTGHLGCFAKQPHRQNNPHVQFEAAPCTSQTAHPDHSPTTTGESCSETGKAPQFNLASELGQNQRMLGSCHLSQEEAANSLSFQRCLK